MPSESLTRDRTARFGGERAASVGRNSKEAMKHLCHHPTCVRPVPPEMLACKSHWFMLPEEIRKRIWRTFRPRQEKDKRPSREWLSQMDRTVAQGR